METRKVDALIWREDLYPRFETIPAKVQEYAESLKLLPPVEINQRNELIDGWHRWTAHRKRKTEVIAVRVTQTKSDADLLALAYGRNAHGTKAITPEEKKHGAIRMYADGTGKNEEEIAHVLSVSKATVTRYLKRTKKELKERRRQQAFDFWLACWTYEEIGEKLGISFKSADNYVQEFVKSDKCQKLQIFADYLNPKWKPPLYNIWKKQVKSNVVSHYGNSEPMILDNLLYMYTEPFDIVVDPFAGGGSTIDVCKKRLRRYWVSDRLPIVERLDIRQADIAEGPPTLHKRWGEVKLLFLDPPYWKQAEGKYSKDTEDLANMPLEDFYNALRTFVWNCADKMPHNSRIALLMSNTQWPMEDKRLIDHVFDLVQQITKDNLVYEFRYVCPYESQQYNGNQVNWAKENRRCLVLNRELVVWRINKE